MYSILRKEGRQGQIVHFLAEADTDLAMITDVCNPGSTVEVLGEAVEDIHKFIKSPSGSWVIYEGETEYTPAKNDAKVSVPSPNAASKQDPAKKISDYQEGITIYPSGLVTGTLFEQTVPDKEGSYTGDTCHGHYFTATLETPAKAAEYKIYTEGQERKTVKPCDDYLTVRYENMNAPTATGKRIKVVYDTGEEFEFALEGLTLA